MSNVIVDAWSLFIIKRFVGKTTATREREKCSTFLELIIFIVPFGTLLSLYKQRMSLPFPDK